MLPQYDVNEIDFERDFREILLLVSPIFSNVLIEMLLQNTDCAPLACVLRKFSAN